MLMNYRMFPRWLSWCGLVAFSATCVLSGCRNTAHGVKEDTRTAVQKTGHGIHRAGQKIENAGKK
jgi:predicted small secreted protein